MSLDATFFRKAKRANRAIEITDTEAVIPAVKNSAEIRVALPNRRLKTFEERIESIEENREKISEIEETVEIERKKLLELVKTYKLVGAGVPEVVAQNIKIKELMERRSALARPGVWIEEIKGLTLKDVFESKRDVRKIGVPVYQVKRRVEPITSLYVDIGATAAAATIQAEGVAATAATQVAKMTADAAKTAAEAAKKTADATKGAIIGRKMTFKLKKAPGV
jgi:hypothetical protein